jgi:nucleotide-binding universal stress UspA family protein
MREDTMIAFKEIIVPTDFSEHSLRALDYAVEIAERFSSELKVVYVIEPLIQAADVAWSSVDFDRLNRAHKDSADRQIRALMDERVPKSVAAEFVILTGKPFVEIVRLARADNADLIVMATHGRGAISQILMGSTAEKVVRRAPCPVLTVKHPKQLFEMP